MAAKMWIGTVRIVSGMRRPDSGDEIEVRIARGLDGALAVDWNSGTDAFGQVRWFAIAPKSLDPASLCGVIADSVRELTGADGADDPVLRNILASPVGTHKLTPKERADLDRRRAALPGHIEAGRMLTSPASTPDRVRSYLAKLCAWPPDEVPTDDALIDATERLFCADKEPTNPLTALEAAERRLLEAGGWTLAEPDVYGTERWSHPTWQGGRSEGRQVALTIERRRLAAKGGA